MTRLLLAVIGGAFAVFVCGTCFELLRVRLSVQALLQEKHAEKQHSAEKKVTKPNWTNNGN